MTYQPDNQLPFLQKNLNLAQKKSDDIRVDRLECIYK